MTQEKNVIINNNVIRRTPTMQVIGCAASSQNTRTPNQRRPTGRVDTRFPSISICNSKGIGEFLPFGNRECNCNYECRIFIHSSAKRSVEVAAAFFAVSYIKSPICVATPLSPKTELIDNRLELNRRSPAQ